MGKQIIIHIGVGKTGTTTLQSNVFNKLKNVSCLGRPNHLDNVYKDFIYGVRLAEDYEFQQYTQAFTERVKNAEYNTVIISDENLAFDVASHVARRLKILFPDAHILITIRNQETALISRYSGHEYFLKGTPVDSRVKFISFDEFFDFHIKNHSTGYFRHVKYDDLTKSYASHFGGDRIHLLLFEEMVSNPEAFCEKLSVLTRIEKSILTDLLISNPKQRKSDTAGQHGYARLRSMIPVRSLQKYLPLAGQIISILKSQLQKGEKTQISLNDSRIKLLEGIYGQGNRDLAQRYNLDLYRHRYPGCKV